jgi:hypothetical protein
LLLHPLLANVGKVVVMSKIKGKNPRANININPFSTHVFKGDISMIYDLIGVIGVGFYLLCR